MFKIPRIEKSSYYIDRIMDEMGEFAQKARTEIDRRWANNLSTKRKEQDEIRLNKRKDLELEKIRFLNTKVNQNTRKLIQTFPNFIKVDDVYLKLINTSGTSVKKIEEAISRIKWIGNYCDELTQNFEVKIKKAKTHDVIGFSMKKYLGKVNSLYRKEKLHFDVLEDARKFMAKLPKFEDMYTVGIGGFPNVGKSTLMKAMTGSNVEIQNYPFTTKGLMFSYLHYKDNKQVQIIDTPGLLGREKNNKIEERAELILREYCSKIVFVLDLTESCGYSIEQQLALLKKTSSEKVDHVLYFSKKDLYNEEVEEIFEEVSSRYKKLKQFTSYEELRTYLLDSSLEKVEKFNPAKLKVIK